MRMIRDALLLSAIGLLASGRAAAQDSDPDGTVRDGPGLRYEIRPYLWVPVHLSGDATLRGRDIPVSVGFSDLISKVDFLSAVHFEMWKERFGFLADAAFLKLSGSHSLGPVTADWSSRLLMIDLLFGFRPVEEAFGRESSIRVELDAGGRFAWVDQDADIGRLPLDANRSFARVLLGGRIPLRLTHVWALGASGGVSLPNPGWAATGWVEMDPSSLVAIVLGYRVENFDFPSDTGGVNLTAHGPYVGVGFRFGDGPIY